MNKNLNWFERSARIFAGAILLFLSFASFDHPVARLLALLAGLWLVLEGGCGCCPLYHDLGLKKPGPMKIETILYLMVAGVQVAVGYVWWHAGWIKIWSGNFIAELPVMLSKYAAGNPHHFMGNFLTNQATRYYGLYGGLVELAQYMIGIGLVALAYLLITAKTETTRRAVLYLSAVGLAFGVFMNAMFYLAVGHLDTWIAAGNVVMFWVQLVLIYGFVNLLMAGEPKK